MDQRLRMLSTTWRQQTSGTIAIYVVSNEPLHGLPADPRVTNLVVPNLGPASNNAARPSWEELWRDKGCKLFLAATAAEAMERGSSWPSTPTT